MGRKGRSTRLCREPSYARTHSSLSFIKIQTNKKTGLLRLFVNSYFTFLHDHYQDFCFPLSRHKHAKIKLCQKNNATSQRNKLALYQSRNGGSDYYIIKLCFTILLGTSYTIRAFKYYIAD